jgi:hypothetical protein
VKFGLQKKVIFPLPLLLLLAPGIRDGSRIRTLIGTVPVYVPRQALVAEPPVLLAPVDGLLSRLDPRHGQAAVGLQPRQNLHIIPLNECYARQEGQEEEMAQQEEDGARTDDANKRGRIARTGRGRRKRTGRLRRKRTARGRMTRSKRRKGDEVGTRE